MRALKLLMWLTLTAIVQLIALMALISLIMPRNAYGQAGGTLTPNKGCQEVLEALNACQELVQAQDGLITQLKANNKVLEGAIGPPIVPNWLLYLGAFIAGVAIGRTFIK